MPRFMPFRFAALLGILGGWLLTPVARATSVAAPEFEQLVSQADYVVRVVVKSINSEWRENQGHAYIASKVELELHEILKGVPPQPLVLEFVGGRVGTEELVIEGAPKFHVGEENILFVQGNGHQIYPLVGIMHGLYLIYKETKSGPAYVLRSNGMPLYSEQEVALPMTAWDAIKRLHPQALPMTAAAFSQKIRSVGTHTAPTSELAK